MTEKKEQKETTATFTRDCAAQDREHITDWDSAPPMEKPEWIEWACQQIYALEARLAQRGQQRESE